MSLAEASKQLKSLGRGEDTELVHMTPLEVQWLSQMQGGTVINPRTGLPEFGLLGKILKGVARAAGAVGGFMVAGPAGAAVGAGLGTKLTGGSWGDALKTGALSGLGSFAAQGLTGGGWNLTGGGAGAASAAGAGGLTAAEAGAVPGLAGYGGAAAAPSIGSQFLSAAMTPGGGAAGLSALGSKDMPRYDDSDVPELPKDTFELKRANPFNRALQKYQGDYATYGMGPGFQFFDEVNPQPTYLRQGGPVRGYAEGGEVNRTGQQIMGPLWNYLDDVEKNNVEMFIESPKNWTDDEIRELAVNKDRTPLRGLGPLERQNFWNLLQSPKGWTVEEALEMSKAGGHAKGGRVQRYAYGGPVTMTPGMPQMPGTSMPMPQQMPMLTQTPMMARTGPGGVGMMQAGSIGGMPMAAPGIDPYAQLSRDGVMRLKGGGPLPLTGKGGKDDAIPALLAEDENVWAAADVADLGDGSSETGHRRLEWIKQQVRKNAGRKNTKRTSTQQRGIGSLVTRAMRRSA